jgi:two-component system, NarL family, nitrate/nitrite response regulator NarL
MNPPMSNARVSVYVADDHPIFREGIVRAIRERPDLELVGDAADGRTALEDISALRPAVAVLDVNMPELGGLEILNAIRRDELPTRVLFLTAHTESELVYEAVAGGAAGYLSKDATREAVCDAVRSAARGGSVLSVAAQTGLMDQIQRRGAADASPLSPREREILHMIAEGKSAPQIAAEIHLSPATVKTHLQSLYDKLGVGDRAAAVAVGMRRGLLE